MNSVEIKCCRCNKKVDDVTRYDDFRCYMQIYIIQCHDQTEICYLHGEDAIFNAHNLTYAFKDL